MTTDNPERRDFLKATTLLGAGLALQAASADAEAAAAPARRLFLWPAGSPDPVPAGVKLAWRERAAAGEPPDREITGVDRPFIDLHLPAEPRGPAVILMPGGGYRHLAVDKEGYDLAKWFAARGIVAGVLVYRLPAEGWASGGDAALGDACRAVRLLRGEAKTLGIDPAQLAVMGFSAGGHLAANLGAQFARTVYKPVDDSDRLSARPDLVAALYPAIEIDQLSASLPTGETIFGRDSGASLAAHMPHRNVPDNPVPHFLVHAEDDPLVNPSHTLALRAALRAKGGITETQLFARGGHGFGLRKTAGLPVAAWPEAFVAFGRSLGWRF